MVIIFYDIQGNNLHICSENQKMIIVSVDDPDALSFIPNDDILYVQNGHFLTKAQFGDFLSGNYEIAPSEEINHTDENVDFAPQTFKGPHIHPRHNGTILIQDLPHSNTFPEGILKLSGKYDFKPVEQLGGFETLEESAQFRFLLAQGKIEVVDYNFVKKNSRKQQASLADAALDAIIIKDDARGSAESVAAQGGIGQTPASHTRLEAIEINIEG